MKEKVFVIGGLGFIGYHLVRRLQENGYNVKIGSRSKLESDVVTSPIVRFDLDKMKDDEISEVLSGTDVVIFAGGVDDRNIPKGDAEAYFYNGNVSPCVRLARISKELNVKRIIILGSYFSHFNRTKPEWKMTENHVYVRSRLRQQTETKAMAGDGIRVSVLEIPYVFGSAPGLIPLWKPLIAYISKTPIVFYTRGGTNICSVEQVAGALVGMVDPKVERDHWVVGGRNVTWVEMIQMMSKAMGKKRRVISVPNIFVYIGAALTKGYFRLVGKQSGLDPFNFIRTQTAHTFIDSKESKSMLGYADVDLQTSIDQTVIACGFGRED